MQIIENGPLGLRSAVLRLQSRSASCKYLLFPMVHIGEAAFYDEVVTRIAQCDHILVEGAKHPLFESSMSQYKMVARSPRFCLVTQAVMGPKLNPFRDRIKNIDVPPELFATWWREQSVCFRTMLPIFHRFIFWFMARFGDREKLAQYMPVTLGPTRESILRMSEASEFSKLVVERRDEYITSQLDQFHMQHRDDPGTVAIVFGAGHARAIIRTLIDKHGYYVAEGSWLTIFGWTLPSSRTRGGMKFGH